MAENKQTERSRQWIVEALLQLMETMPFREISVTDLTKKAGVSRLTFYRNFESKEDVLRLHYRQVFRQYLEHLDQKSMTTPKDALALCYRDWKCEEHEIWLVLQNHLEQLIYEPFEEYLEVLLTKYRIGTGLSRNQKRFLVGGLYFSMLDWVEHPQHATPEERAAGVLSMLKL